MLNRFARSTEHNHIGWPGCFWRDRWCHLPEHRRWRSGLRIYPLRWSRGQYSHIFGEDRCQWVCVFRWYILSSWFIGFWLGLLPLAINIFNLFIIIFLSDDNRLILFLGMELLLVLNICLNNPNVELICFRINNNLNSSFWFWKRVLISWLFLLIKGS